MKRRCVIDRDPRLRAQVEAAIANDIPLRAIAASLSDGRVSRTAIGRYARRYRAEARNFLSSKSRTGGDLKAALALPKFADIRSKISLLEIITDECQASDAAAKESALRAYYGQNPGKAKANGASPASISFIKRKILGLE